MEKVFASVRFSSPLPVAVARTSQSPFPLCTMRQATVKPYNQLTKSTNLTKKISKFEANNRYRKL